MYLGPTRNVCRHAKRTVTHDTENFRTISGLQINDAFQEKSTPFGNQVRCHHLKNPSGAVYSGDS